MSGATTVSLYLILQIMSHGLYEIRYTDNNYLKSKYFIKAISVKAAPQRSAEATIQRIK
jgi:hypothetical protein